jgi:hypothetical protein
MASKPVGGAAAAAPAFSVTVMESAAWDWNSNSNLPTVLGVKTRSCLRSPWWCEYGKGRRGEVAYAFYGDGGVEGAFDFDFVWWG